jgi:hypothetical protein
MRPADQPTQPALSTGRGRPRAAKPAPRAPEVNPTRSRPANHALRAPHRTEHPVIPLLAILIAVAVIEVTLITVCLILDRQDRKPPK